MDELDVLLHGEGVTGADFPNDGRPSPALMASMKAVVLHWAKAPRLLTSSFFVMSKPESSIVAGELVV